MAPLQATTIDRSESTRKDNGTFLIAGFLAELIPNDLVFAHGTTAISAPKRTRRMMSLDLNDGSMDLAMPVARAVAANPMTGAR
jgi:hypothetical protein